MPTYFPNQAKQYNAELIGSSVTVSGVIRLIKADFTLAPGLVFADLTEADFDGYAGVGFALDSSGLDAPNNRGFALFVPVVFTKTAGATTNIIYGWVMTHPAVVGGAEVIVMIKKYSPPLGMINPGDEITVEPEYRTIVCP